MVVDSSALLAILLSEPMSRRLYEGILAAEATIAAPNVLEATMVAARVHGNNAEVVVQRLLTKLSITVVPFGPEHLPFAIEAFEQFGKGRHPAGLNFGDCIAYATAKMAGQPLLFVGADFAKTDIEAA